ncbi:glycine--tRNA ligase subunit beta [Paraglaciecola hydrolytica]|uniref:Glycine--tRNA ligase beta subunit n=1 Tax=Paraglaciecola hydrolytica TaxID=1799789 RepID=A0A136A458_9ALTE|nr:glycine--tRNA ligase subunit beta [Paraglaciecola hydrolytica]KXI30022.1 glycine--tRNA ligase subunit beta [Paraglaciecola hydrolytica]
MNVENLLIEIGTEELPPKSLAKLASNFAQNIEKAFTESEFSFSSVTWYATPRRLAVSVLQLAEMQNDRIVEVRGPAVTVAFDASGNPTPAAIGWAKSNGIKISNTTRLKTDKGEWLYYKGTEKGLAVSQLISTIVDKALATLPIPKPMKWGSNTIQFIRPIHTVTMVYGKKLVSGKVFGIESSRTILAHRFMGPKSFVLNCADDYLQDLKNNFVIADFTQRKELIRQQIQDAAAKENAVADMNDELLEEVASLVEWPVALVASFDESFLAVPKEALIYTMKGDQKYFPLLDSAGNLKSRFIFISNIESSKPELVISGNEKVIRPRLADAEFFFNTDKKHTLESRLESLDTILFQKQLGSLLDKTKRIANLASSIAQSLGADAELAHRAGMLSKTDLMTNMVMEFPDVQGIMGMYYATIDGENSEVATALNEQYMPRFSGDSLPQSPISISLAIADKIDTLVGIFGIGQVPKGDKDPFALRRAAIGLLRIIVDKNLPIDLEIVVEASISTFGDKVQMSGLKQAVVDFVLARFKAWYLEQGIEIDVIQAVSEIRPTRPADFAARVQAITLFKNNPAAITLAAANKRVANILAKNPVNDFNTIDSRLLKESAEQDLVNALEATEAKLEGLLGNGDYNGALENLAKLRGPIDDFFENVMVMADEQDIRNNRLHILSRLRALFLSCGDISLLSQQA